MQIQTASRVAVLLHPDDDVATALRPLSRGKTVSVENGERRVSVELRDDIPFGHKFALRALKKGELIRKYGHPIGIASQDIEPGQHVHVHNVEAQRGRGDLKKG